MSEFAVWALGADRPGIVAAVTGGLFQLGGNLLDTSMTILSGHFAMMLLVDAPDGIDEAQIEQSLAAPAAAFDLVVAARAVAPGTTDEPEGDPHVVAVYGADRPGIVHHVASLLAEHSVNITDLTTRVIGETAEPVYAMLLEVTLPAGMETEDLAAPLRALAAELGVDASVHLADADIL